MLPLPAGRLDVDAREVRGVGDVPVELLERECELLATLAARPQRVFGRDDPLALVFPDASNPIAVDTYVHDVRRKLGRGVIDTIRGRGYRIGRCPR